jgi:hypothetical protein
VFNVYVNTVPLYIRNLSIWMEILVFKGALEPIPEGY